MQVAVITDEISQDIKEAIEVMLRCDCSVAEIRAVWGKNSIDLTPQELAQLRRVLNDTGVQVCAVSSPFYKCDISEDARAARGRMHDAKELTLADQMDVLQRSFDVAETLDTNLVRVFSFWRTEDPTPEIENRIVELFEEPIRMAEARGMKLLMENEHACYLGTGRETARVLERLGSSWSMRAVWDPGNAFCAGETPYPGGYEAIKPWIEHVHIKDTRRAPDGKVQFVKVGEGEVGYQQQIARLASDGYDGVLSLETHYSIDNGGKAGASEESLKALTALVQGV